IEPLFGPCFIAIHPERINRWLDELGLSLQQKFHLIQVDNKLSTDFIENCNRLPQIIGFVEMDVEQLCFMLRILKACLHTDKEEVHALLKRRMLLLFIVFYQWKIRQ